MKAFETKAVSVADIFNKKEYVIPAFQRPYSWTDQDQCQMLWDDLTGFYEANQETKSRWFLGSVVLCKAENPNENVYSVVDGQQRLTTLFLLIAVLKNKFNTFQALQEALRLKNGLTGCLLDSPRIRSEVAEDQDSSLLLKKFACENDPQIDDKQYKKSNLVKNYRYFDQKINEWIQKVDATSATPDLYKESFVRFLLERVELLCIHCEDEEDAFRVFEVVNDRGMELSPVQIIKPRLMAGLDEEGRKIFLTDWNLWTSSGEKKEDNHPLVSFLFQTLKEIRAVKDSGEPDCQSTSLSKYFKDEALHDVHDDINKLFAIHKWNPPDELAVLMEILNQISSKTYKVPLYAYLYHHGCVEGGTFVLDTESEKKAVGFCRDLVRFVYGLSLAGKTSRDDMRKPCYDQVKWVFDASAVYKFSLSGENLKEIERKLKAEGFCEEDCYKHGVGSGLVLLASYLYAIKNKSGDRLSKLADLLRKGFEREHICPRKSGSCWVEGWDQDIHAKLLNSIGNLIPLEEEINLKIQNNGFLLKRDGERGCGIFRDQKTAVCYKKSKSPEASEYLAKRDSWTPDDVREFAKTKCNVILKFLKEPSEGSK